MSMNCVLYAVSAQQAERLRDVEDEEQFFQELEAASPLDVGQEWHGLHYVLTGTAAGFPAPQGFLVEGGDELEGTDGGYGPGRIFSPREVDDIHSVLVDISAVEFESRFDPAQMNADQVYGFQWLEDSELMLKVYLESFMRLKQFVDEASRRGQCLVVLLH